MWWRHADRMMPVMASAHPALSSEQQVTASDLVRRFGFWQDRAVRAPVYVLHHGRPRFVLTSVDVMDALFGNRDVADPADTMLAETLDTLADAIVIIDRSGSVMLANRVARGRYGSAVRIGASPAAIVDAGDAFLAPAIARVLATGIGESLEIVTHRYPDRRVEAVLSPLPLGCMMLLADTTRDAELADAEAQIAATRMAIEDTGVAAVVRIGARGQIVKAGSALSHLTGIARDRLSGARFATLIAISGRAATGEAIERALAGHGVRLTVDLLVDGMTTRPVTLAMAALPDGGAIIALLADRTT